MSGRISRGELQPVGLYRVTVDLHGKCRGHRDHGHEARGRHDDKQQTEYALAVAEECGKAPLQLPQRVALRVGRMGFDQIAADTREYQHTADGDGGERRPPAPLRHQQRTDSGRNYGRHGEDHRHQRHQFRGLLAARDVADDGARQHDSRGATETLYETCGKHHVDALRHGGDDCGKREQAHAGVEHRQAAEAVGDQSRRDLAAGHAEHERADNQLASRQAGRQRRHHIRYRRQAHVDRQRGDSRQQTEREDKTPPDNKCRVHGTGTERFTGSGGRSARR